MPGRDFRRFLVRHLVNAFVSKCNLLITPRLLPTDAGYLCVQLHTNNLHLTPSSYNQKTITKIPLNEIPSMCLAHIASVAVMALNRRVLKEGDILSELYADTFSDVSDNSEGEFLVSDSDVPTASSHKQFQLPTVALTSDSDKYRRGRK